MTLATESRFAVTSHRLSDGSKVFDLLLFVPDLDHDGNVTVRIPFATEEQVRQVHRGLQAGALDVEVHR